MLPEKVTKKDLAKLFGLSARRIEQLKQDGILFGEGNPAKFPLVENAKAYTKYLSDKAYGREQKKGAAELEKEKLEADVRIKKAKAEMAEQELKELKGELHRAEDVEEITTNHVLLVRGAIMALPGRLAVDLAGTHTAAEQAARVQEEVNGLLEVLSDFSYGPEEYARRVRERQGWDERDIEEEG